MKVCKKCNIEREVGEFCDQCGSKLETINEEQTDSETSPKENENLETTESIKTDDYGVIDLSDDETEEVQIVEDAVIELDSDKEEITEPTEIITEEEKKRLKEEKQKEKEKKKQEKEKKKQEKEALKKAKEDEKAAKAQAKLDKKQAQLEAKMKKQEEQEAKRKAKEEKKRIKAEKKANRKFKKTRRALWIILILILIILGLFIWYLGHSQIDDNYTESDANVNVVLEMIANDSDFNGKIMVDYDDFNSILNNNVDFSEMDAITAATIVNGYYSPENKNFVITLHSFLGTTSLLLDMDDDFSDDSMNLTLDNPKLGYLKLPVPSSLAKTPIEQSVDLPKFTWVTIEDIDFEKDGVEIEYDFDTKNINTDLKLLNEALKPELIKYLDESNIKLPGVHVLVKAREKGDGYEFTDDDIQSILYEFSKDKENIVNWTVIMPENLSKDIVNLSNLFNGEEKTQELLKKINTDKKELLNGFNDFVTDEIEDTLKDSSTVVFEKLKSIHKEKGVPSYYYGDKGHLYSQTLEQFISLEDLLEDLGDDNKFKLYAFGNKAILASIVDNEIWYVIEGKDEVKKTSAKDFVSEIKLKKGVKLNRRVLGENDVNEANTFAQAIISYEGYVLGDMLELNYLAYSDNYALAIASLYNKPKLAPQYYLLKNDGGWEVIDSFAEDQSIGMELIEEFESGEISPQILPKYEMADFEIDALSTKERKKIKKLLPEDCDILDYAKVENNILIRAETAPMNISTFLFPYGTDGDYATFKDGEKVSEMVKKLRPNAKFVNYKPEFIFNSTGSIFGTAEE